MPPPVSAEYRNQFAAITAEMRPVLRGKSVKWLEETRMKINALKKGRPPKQHGFICAVVSVINAEINNRARHGFKVTDHAVIRYMEREMRIDIESVREKIIEKSMDGDINAVVRDGVIVTVYDRKWSKA